jgi:CheY-like chemotaxis protein
MKTILIVEDIELNRELLAQLLEDKHRLVFAEDGVARSASAPRLARPDTDGSVAAAYGWLGSHAPAQG